MQTLHSYTMFTSSSKYFRTCSKIAIITRGQWWIWSLDANSSGFLFQEIFTAPLASQLQEPEELVSSLEKVQIQYLILNSISQADNTFCCICMCLISMPLPSKVFILIWQSYELTWLRYLIFDDHDSDMISLISKNFAHLWRESWGWAWGALCPDQPASWSSSPIHCEPPPSPTFPYSPHFCFKFWIIWKSLQVKKYLYWFWAKILSVLDTAAQCFFLSMLPKL